MDTQEYLLHCSIGAYRSVDGMHNYNYKFQVEYEYLLQKEKLLLVFDMNYNQLFIKSFYAPL